MVMDKEAVFWFEIFYYKFHWLLWEVLQEYPVPGTYSVSQKSLNLTREYALLAL